MKLLLAWIFLAFFADVAIAKDTIDEINVEGNFKVESDAILNALSLKKGSTLTPEKVSKDLQALYDLGFFSDIRLSKIESDKTLVLKIKVVEKPAIVSIRFEGLDELKEDDFKTLLDSKLYTIVKEGTIAADVRKIEKKYTEKGFYLAKVDYTLEEKSKNEVELVFHVDERGKVIVGDVFILGNRAFSSSELIENLATRPYTRLGAFGSGSLFQNDYVNRDVEYLSFFYKDNGFANVKVAKPVIIMDPDQRYVRVTFQVEEGLQYNLGSIKVTEDGNERLLAEKDLIEAMALKSTQLFRYSRFVKDVEMLVDKYGDLGYAYVDVNPKTTFNDETKTVDIHYDVTKGQKVYFGQIVIAGNTKTRDNVIRREMQVHESELFSGTRLTGSKNNINRLGYFDEVQVAKERHKDQEDVVNVKVKVKEKPTGQVQASLGYSPAGERKQSWFGQGRYDEKNQSGRGWTTTVMGRYSNPKDWEVEVGMSDPKVYDSPWSLGASVAERRFVRRYTSEIEVPEAQRSFSVTVGRDIIELIRGSLTLRHTYIKQLQEVFIFEGFAASGAKNTASFNLGRKDLDNFIDPTQGTWVSLSHNLNGGPLRGDFQYMESLVDAWYYHPIDYTDSFRTFFRLRGVLGKLWKFRDQNIPASERYRLGGFDNLRGYPYQMVGPKERRLRSPLSGYYDYPLGGDKELYFQFEYLVPLIPKAGIKAVFFADAGRTFLESEGLALKDLKKDVGFGFRWVTPIAPFRFEWAYPYNDATQSLGDLQFIFTLGY